MSTVTVIVPAYNAGPYLREAVASALNQTHDDLDLIVVDDGSTDGSVQSVEELDDARLRIIRQANAGKSVAMNRALDEAQGQYYCILDADDTMHPERVARQLAALEANSDVAAVFCGHELLMGGRRLAPRLRAKSREDCRKDIEAMRMPAHDPTGMYRMSMVRDIRYEPALRIGQGLDYVLRVGEQWPMLVLEDCLYTYRVLNTSATRANVEQRRAAVHAVKCRAAERRQIDLKLSPQTGAKVTNQDRDNGLSTHFMESVTDLKRLDRRPEAIETALVCARLHPLDPEYWKPFAISVLPAWALRMLGRTRGGARKRAPSTAT